MHTLLVLERNAEKYAAEIEQRLPGTFTLQAATASDPARRCIADVDIILGRPAYVAELLPAAKRLSWVQSTFAGVEQLCAAGLPRGYVLTGVKGVFGPLMSEYVFAYILAIERHLFETHQRQRHKNWDAIRYRSLKHLTIGIAGLGSIGRHIAKTADHFGMRVYGLKRSPGHIDPVEKVFLPTATEPFLSELDYLVLALPDTPQTRHFMNGQRFRQMNESAILINIGRGRTVDENALVHALRKKYIRGAVLDVFQTEPLPQSSPLWQMPRVIITPHTAAFSFVRDIVDIFCDNYQRWITGMPLRYAVDFERGY